MTPEFWHTRWEAGQIGFHQPEVHSYLPQLWPNLPLKGRETVFVPLCGKSLDMLWLLERGHRVVGIELSPLAVEAFFAESGLMPEMEQFDRYRCYRFDELTIYCGDFFHLEAEALREVSVVYDRASLIALPPPMRQRYAAHLNALLPQPVSIFLVTLHYPQEQMQGPPFAVSPAEIEQLYGERFMIQPLVERSILAEEPRFQQQGLTALEENSYWLTSA